jgi:hypothetical protein
MDTAFGSGFDWDKYGTMNDLRDEVLVPCHRTAPGKITGLGGGTARNGEGEGGEDCGAERDCGRVAPEADSGPVAGRGLRHGQGPDAEGGCAAYPEAAPPLISTGRFGHCDCH